ncbi:hypothetical protein BB561_001948 [Smittium simulii]|uniref:Uncharacterized protein n=1 Tax=Smittium simulii TaxID=133385 RepID=A0A2T9YSA4_9FUNG|nr:hypothetical protein BB561_001948 [Smittium simulii]
MTASIISQNNYGAGLRSELAKLDSQYPMSCICKSRINWSKIITALKYTPNTAETDTVPSEVWKLDQNEDEPESNLAKLILKSLTKFIPQMNFQNYGHPVWWYLYVRNTLHN